MADNCTGDGRGAYCTVDEANAISGVDYASLVYSTDYFWAIIFAMVDNINDLGDVMTLAP